LKKHKSFQYGDLSFSSSGNIDPEQIKDLINQIKLQTQILWQNRWNVSTKGRLTYEFMNNISSRMSASWFNLNYYVVQVLTGHGNFNYKLHYFKLVESPYCRCGSIDTIQHFILTCPFFDDLRETVREHVKINNTWPCELTILIGEENYKVFANFVRTALQRKERFDFSESSIE